MASKKKSGNEPFDLNAGMIEAVTNPPTGFISKHRFKETDISTRVKAIDWFVNCGKPTALDLTMNIEQVKTWNQAMKSCKSLKWETVELEAQNQLTLWLHLHDHGEYQKWNKVVDAHKKAVINPLKKNKIEPFQTKAGLNVSLVHSVQWDVLGALMENSYMNSGHSVFFFFELLLVYESGHFPCGWKGRWPKGNLIVF